MLVESPLRKRMTTCLVTNLSFYVLFYLSSGGNVAVAGFINDSRDSPCLAST